MESIHSYNRDAWDHAAETGNPWTLPVSAETIAQARNGQWDIVLTPKRPVPKAWFPELKGASVLGLASGGGQQGPILAAAGARVTVFDASAKQLEQDEMVRRRDGLELTTVQGDMADLSVFKDSTFDLIFHPCSNGFAPEILGVWRETHRVLKTGGVLLSGFANSSVFMFDQNLMERGVLSLRHKLPYSELKDISDAERDYYQERQVPLIFGHTLSDQIGGQIEAGFALTGFYEDADDSPLSRYIEPYMATRATKL